ncbi:hypothetical protein GJV44_00268 [Candidatus Vallotia cooleyia]|nr:hypothetical protein GJV44_00268 [Candidatus Vallotia cooleyia]
MNVFASLECVIELGLNIDDVAMLCNMPAPLIQTILRARYKL